jgi:hypothetical protein
MGWGNGKGNRKRKPEKGRKETGRKRIDRLRREVVWAKN